MKILVADDDSVSRFLLENFLTKLGHRVTVAIDGDVAWHLFSKDPHDIVVSDWKMPGFDGLELCEKIRNHNTQAYTYFILITANADEEGGYEDAMESGVDDFLTKPFDRNQLGQRLKVAKRIIEHSRHIRELTEVVRVCAYTKKVQIPDADWQSIEDFLRNRFGIETTHGISPEYYDTHLKPELDRMKITE